MKYFRYSLMFLLLGCLSLLHIGYTDAEKKVRHRRNNQLEWTAWTEWSSCTAPCGTGAAYRERMCIDRRARAYSNKCHGTKHQFKICNTQECNQGQEPLREQLCSKHNEDVIGGRRYRWIPYLLHSARCELTCRADGQGFYNSFPDPIVNGTVCTKDGSSVCVEGVCKSFGCDGIVESHEKKDSCGICGGDGSTCRMVHDVFEEDNLEHGYNLVTIIPAGATSINVTQLRAGRNYLALKYKDGKYIINGHRRLSPASQYEAAGATFTYKNRASDDCPGECFLADGPTNKDLEIMLLYFGRNTGVLYQFGYPIDQNGILKYQDLSVSGNSEGTIRIGNEHNIQISTNNHINRGNINHNRQIGDDYDHFNVVLGDRKTNTNINSNLDRQTDRNNQRNTNNRDFPTSRYDATVVIEESERKPNRLTPTDKMEKSYYISSISGQSKLPGYTQSFTFMDKMKEKMHKNGVNGQNDPMYPDSDRNKGNVDRNGRLPIIVSNPIDPETVAVIYSWKVIGYTDCNRTCGTGIKKPIIRCLREAKEVPDQYCAKLSLPADSSVECNTQSCPASWEASAWTACSATCDEGIQIRNISCLQEASESLFLETSLEDCSHLTAPATSQKCKLRDCFTWSTGSWSECSANCGKGVRTRTVNCTSIDGYNVPDFYCNSTDVPVDQEACYSSCQNRYSAAWYFTDWQKECPVSCGSGKQRRRVACVSENPYGPDCQEREKPEEERPCQARETCNGYWFSGPWQECNATCGEGVRKRDIMCLRPNGNTAYEVIPDEYCNLAEKPLDYEICRSSPCPAEWFTTDWSECSATCDKGQRSREVLCINTDNREANDCDTSDKPSSIEECGTAPCNGYRPSESCRDTYPYCPLVLQAGYCSNEGYRKVCCHTCSSQT